MTNIGVRNDRIEYRTTHCHSEEGRQPRRGNFLFYNATQSQNEIATAFYKSLAMTNMGVRNDRIKFV